MYGWGGTLFAAFSITDAIAGPVSQLRRLILASVLFRFVVDSSLSITTGFALNALMNVGFPVAFALPLTASGALRR